MGLPQVMQYGIPRIELFASRTAIHLRLPGPWPDDLETEQRSEKMALSMGLAPILFPQTTGCFSVQLREQWPEKIGGKCW